MKSPKVSLFCFIDALGWKLIEHYGFLSEQLPHRQPLDTLLGYSSTCDPTILTGLWPEQHGHFSFYYYNPKESPFAGMPWLDYLPKSLTRRGRVRHWLSRLLKKWLGYTGYFQIYNMPFSLMPYFDYSEKRDIYQPGGINSGAPTIFREWEKLGVPYFLSPWWCTEEHNLASLKASFQTQRPRAAYLYLAAMDATLHQYGTRHTAVEEKLRWYEQQLQRLLEEAEQHYQQVRLFVFSDHGMTDVTSLCRLRTEMESSHWKFGRDYAAVYDSTMARFWFFDEACRQATLERLSQHPQGRLLSSQDLADYGCSFENNKYGEVFFLAHPGVLLCPSHLGEQPLKGMHGYAPEDQHSWACLLSNVAPLKSVKGLTDLYPLMREDSLL